MLTTKAAYSPFNASLSKHTQWNAEMRRYKDARPHADTDRDSDSDSVLGGEEHIWRLAEA